MPKKRKLRPKVFVSDRKLAMPRFVVGVKKGMKKIALKGFTSRSRAEAMVKRLKKTGLVS